MAEEVHFHGGSMSGNAELSRFVLDSKEYLESLILGMQGYVKIARQDGTFELMEIPERKLNPRCQLFIREKVSEIFNKNMALADYSPEDMWRTQQAISLDFTQELWMNAKEFKLTPERYSELCSMYRNVVDIGLRLPLTKGIRNMLISTTSEQTQNVRQVITDTQEKRGGLFGFLGGK